LIGITVFSFSSSYTVPVFAEISTVSRKMMGTLQVAGNLLMKFPTTHEQSEEAVLICTEGDHEMKKVIAFVCVAFLAVLFLTVSNSSAQAQSPEIRYYVEARGNLWEVITGAPGGGSFITQYRGNLNGRPIVGYTDRASRGESIIVRVLGSGVASQSGVIFNGQIAFSWYNVPLPFLFPTRVTTDPNRDNITSFVDWQGRRYSRRLPLGTRP
jgi:hypothetical protein